MSRNDLLTDLRDDTVERFLERLEHSASPASLEVAQVAAAVRVVTSPTPPARRRRAHGQRLLPRRVPVFSLSAMGALFAGIPAKAALAAAAAVAATTGLAASDNLPDAAMSAMRSAAERVGFTVEQPLVDELPAAGHQRREHVGHIGAAAGGDDQAEPPDPAAAKAAGLGKAAAAPGSAHAGEHKAAGLAKAAAGPANADEHAAAGSANADEHAGGAGADRGPSRTRSRHDDAAPTLGPKAQQHQPRAPGRGERVVVGLPLQVPQRADAPTPAVRALKRSVER